MVADHIGDPVQAERAGNDAAGVALGRGGRVHPDHDPPEQPLPVRPERPREGRHAARLDQRPGPQRPFRLLDQLAVQLLAPLAGAPIVRLQPRHPGGRQVEIVRRPPARHASRSARRDQPAQQAAPPWASSSPASSAPPRASARAGDCPRSPPDSATWRSRRTRRNDARARAVSPGRRPNRGRPRRPRRSAPSCRSCSASPSRRSARRPSPRSARSPSPSARPRSSPRPKRCGRPRPIVRASSLTHSAPARVLPKPRPVTISQDGHSPGGRQLPVMRPARPEFVQRPFLGHGQPRDDPAPHLGRALARASGSRGPAPFGPESRRA